MGNYQARFWRAAALVRESLTLLIGAAKTVKNRAIEVIQSMVHGDSVKPEPRGSKRPKQRKETSARPLGKRVEPGNLSNQDIKAAMS